MRLTERLPLFVALACCRVGAAVAAPSAELVDLAGRIDYGFYNADRPVVEAARAALERLGDSAEVDYYRDLASLRLAQLGGGREAPALVDDCVSRSVPAEAGSSVAAEAWILVAACAAAGGSGRRMEHALAQARALDDDHPRLALVEAWALQRVGGEEAAQRDAVAAKLLEAVTRFDMWDAPFGVPDWGHAEALAALGEITLLRGEVRNARDLVERALLLAPDYYLAVELRARIQGGRATERVP